jgi:hypothetical protein
VSFLRRRKPDCGCGCQGAGGCGDNVAASARPGQFAGVLGDENFYSPRNNPDAADDQASRQSRGYFFSMLHGAEPYANTGLQGHYRQFWNADVTAAAVGVVHPNTKTEKAVPPNQTTLITSRVPHAAHD